MDKAAAQRMFQDPAFRGVFDTHLHAAFIAAEAARGRRLKQAEVDAIGLRVIDDLVADAATRPLVVAAMLRATGGAAVEDDEDDGHEDDEQGGGDGPARCD